MNLFIGDYHPASVVFHQLSASVETYASHPPKPAQAGCDPSET